MRAAQLGCAFVAGILVALVSLGIVIKGVVSEGITVTLESSTISKQLTTQVKARLSEVVNSNLAGARRELSRKIAGHIAGQLGDLPSKIPGFRSGLETLIEDQVNEVLNEKVLMSEIDRASGPFANELAGFIRERIHGSKYPVTIFGRYSVPVTVLVR